MNRPTNDRVESRTDQFELFLNIARSVTARGLTVYRCRYDFLAFGSWVIEAGTSHRRLQIARDGKEGMLRCSTSSFDNAASVARWVEQEALPLSADAGASDVMETTDALIRKHAPTIAR